VRGATLLPGQVTAGGAVKKELSLHELIYTDFWAEKSFYSKGSKGFILRSSSRNVKLNINLYLVK
jgi:hypothetical protein